MSVEERRGSASLRLESFIWLLEISPPGMVGYIQKGA
jgi:hypothetical protein